MSPSLVKPVGAAAEHPKGWWLKRLWVRLRGLRRSPRRAAASVFVGLFIGSLPLYGVHLPLCLLCCVPLRLDAVTAYLAANISNPLFAPFLVFAQVQVGSVLLNGSLLEVSIAGARELEPSAVVSYLLVGAPLVAVALASLGAVVTRAVVGKAEPEIRTLEEATDRVVQRYRTAQIKDRLYVRFKLSSDPLTMTVAELGELGDVLDVACGRGQFGILARELSHCRSLVGLDWDERRIAVAREAARDGERFECRDALDADLPAADTVLLLDVLHYLTVEAQARLLAAAFDAVRPGGRLVVRQLASRRHLTVSWERLCLRLGFHRAATLEPRPPAELVQALDALGVSDVVIVESPAAWTAPVVVARR